MNPHDTTFVVTSAAVDAFSASVSGHGETAQSKMSSKLSVAGSTKPPGLNETIEAPLTPLPFETLLSPGASAAVVAIANAAPQSTVDRGAGRAGGGILIKEDDSSRKVDVALVKASLQSLARAASEAAKDCRYDDDNDDTGGGRPRCGGQASAVLATFPCRAACALQATPELCQRGDDLLFAAAALNSFTTDDLGKDAPQRTATAATATDVRASPASSAPHSTAETQWHNTSEASEPDLHEVLSPDTGASTEDLTAISSVTASSPLGGSASSATMSERPAEPAPIADLAAKGRALVSVSETLSPFQRSTTGLQQPAQLSDCRRKRASDKSAMQLERSSGGRDGHGDAPLLSLKNTLTWRAETPTCDGEPPPTLLLSPQRRGLLDSNVCTPVSTEVATATTQATVVSGSASHPSNLHYSPQAFDTHTATERSASITTICGPRQAIAPSPQSSPPIFPGGAVVTSASLGVPVRSPLGLPMPMSGSTASLAFPRCASAFPPRATPDTVANSSGDESAQQSPRRHDQKDEDDSLKPLLSFTAPVVTPAAQHVSSLTAAAWSKSLRSSPIILSRQQQQPPQQQQQVQLSPFQRPPYGAANTPESDSKESFSVPPQQSLGSFTVASTTSVCADNPADPRSPPRMTAEHSSLHDSAMSTWQNSTTSEDRILQTLAHGMALGGVATGPWKALQDNSAPPTFSWRATELQDQCLTEEPLAPQRSMSRSSRLAASCTAGADSSMHHSPWNCTSFPCGPSLLVPPLHGTDRSRSTCGGTRVPLSRGKSPMAVLASSPTRFLEPQLKQGKLGGMSSTRPAVARGRRPAQMRSPVSVLASSEGDDTADANSHSRARNPRTAARPRPRKRRMEANTPKRLQQRRERPNSGYLFAVANNSSLRSAGGSTAAAPPALVASVHHAERSLVTPMRGYSFKQHSATASVASSALSQVPFVVEGVISAGSTLCRASWVEAAVATRWRVASTDTAARRPGGNRAVMLRSDDSSAAHYRMLSSGFFSAADSSIAVAAPMEALLEEQLTFLQSVHDVGGFAAQAAEGASLDCTAAAQNLLAGETAGLAGVATPAVSPPSQRSSPPPAPILSTGLVSGRMRRVTAGGVLKAPSFDATGTAGSSPAMTAAAPSGSSIKSPGKVSERISTKLPTAKPTRVANDSIATEPIALMGERPSVCAPSPPTSAMWLRPSLTRRPSYRIPGSEAVATPQLIEGLSVRNNVSARPSDSTRSAFLPILPLALEEKAATPSIYELGTPRAMNPMSSSPEADYTVAAAPRRAADTYHLSTPTHGNSGESGTHSAALSISCRSPPGILPPPPPPQQQQTPLRLQMCVPAAMWPSLYGVHDDQDACRIADRSSSTRAALILSSLTTSSNSIVDRTASTDTRGGEGYGQRYRPNGEAHFHERGALAGSSSQYRGSGRGGDGVGTRAPLSISIPRYERYRDVEALLDDAERVMNRTAVPIVSLLGYGSWSVNGDEYSFETLGNGMGSSVMSLATPALTTSITGPNTGLVSPLVPETILDKPVASSTGTIPSLSASAPGSR
ncbi:hypothetical protein GH5_05155 [Leishmania sp. Ghana 2012 LV757]|uniref:hypothetical protein n=1 Tax=Leishmania sp. Ghana 2012 LV757 TaxID=2803181 RepID=UPI001B5E6547|nr:hypothetical protein GH5_05155 [Leishmania sp. Ghana 2012 LV757]